MDENKNRTSGPYLLRSFEILNSISIFVLISFLSAKMTNFQSKLQVSNGSESSKCLELRYFPFGCRESEKLKEIERWKKFILQKPNGGSGDIVWKENLVCLCENLNLWNFYILFFLWWPSKWRNWNIKEIKFHAWIKHISS